MKFYTYLRGMSEAQTEEAQWRFHHYLSMDETDEGFTAGELLLAFMHQALNPSNEPDGAEEMESRRQLAKNRLWADIETETLFHPSWGDKAYRADYANGIRARVSYWGEDNYLHPWYIVTIPR